MSTEYTLVHGDIKLHGETCSFHLYTDCFDNDNVVLTIYKPCRCYNSMTIPLEIFKTFASEEIYKKACDSLKNNF